MKITPQIAVKAFYLALGSSSIGPAQPWHEAIILGQIQQLGMPAMMTITIGVSFQHDCAGIVIQNLSGHATQRFKHCMMTRHQRISPLVGHILDPSPTTVSQGGCECIQRIDSSAKYDEVTLHLLTWRGLETHDRITLGPWLVGTHEGLKASQLARIALLAQLSEQSWGGNHIGVCGLHATDNVVMKWPQSGGTRLTLFISRGLITGCVSGNSVTRDIQAACDLTLRQTLGD